MDESRSYPTPPGWPDEVLPPGAPGWERTAIAWLTGLLPPQVRAEVLHRHPRALSLLARSLVDAQTQGLRHAYSAAHRELDGAVPAEVVEEVLGHLAARGPELVQLSRSVTLVGDALGGTRWRPGAVPSRRA
jgi:hypothetical protein